MKLPNYPLLRDDEIMAGNVLAAHHASAVQQHSSTRSTDPTALRAVRVVHTIAWAFFAGCIVAMPIAAWRGQHAVAASLAAIVAVEVLVLALNRWRCPLTNVAARYTEDRRANFDIYLPLWVARHNQRIFGFLYLAGLAYTVAHWARASG